MEALNSSLRPGSRHIVVSVDDEPAILSALRRLLRNEPFEFLATGNPDEAMRWIVEKRASLVVADQRMPAMSGLDFLEKVKACSPATVRVMLTAQSDHPEAVLVRDFTAVQLLLRKPWEPDELKLTLRELLLSCENSRESARSAV